jgi:hypothetical protein
VISNVHRSGDEGKPLKTCPVHYFDFPNDNLRKQFNDEIAAFNQTNNATSQAGFNLLERMRNESSEREIPVIFFTSEAAGKIGTKCSTLVTNRFDILLQQVVSTLALGGGRAWLPIVNMQMQKADEQNLDVDSPTDGTQSPHVVWLYETCDRRRADGASTA